MIINSYAFAAPIVSDVTPDTVDASYSTTNEYGFADSHSNKYFQVVGINETITLEVSIPGDPFARLACRVMTTLPVGELTENPLGGPWSLLSNGQTINISNNEYFVFGGYYILNDVSSFILDIINASDGDTLITTVECYVDNS